MRRLRSAALPVWAPLLEPGWLADQTSRPALDVGLLEQVESLPRWRCHQVRSELGRRILPMVRIPPHCLRRWPHPGRQDHRHQVAVLGYRAMGEALQVALMLAGVPRTWAEV